ncbi:hypothetical protein, partial [Pseudomonas viridiflava]
LEHMDQGWSDPTNLFDDNGMPLPSDHAMTEVDKIKAQISLFILSGLLPGLRGIGLLGDGSTGLFSGTRIMSSESAGEAALTGAVAGQQFSVSIEIGKFLFGTAFPVHLLDGDDSRLVNPIVQSQGANPSSDGYAAGATPASV